MAQYINIDSNESVDAIQTDKEMAEKFGTRIGDWIIDQPDGPPVVCNKYLFPTIYKQKFPRMVEQ